MIKVHKAADGKLKQLIEIRQHQIFSDEPVEVGGDDQAPAPTELLQSALGACTSITVTMVARRDFKRGGRRRLPPAPRD
jgi:putative redox protein